MARFLTSPSASRPPGARACHAAFLAMIPVILLASSAYSQTTTTISSEPSCLDCVRTLTVAEIDSREAPGSLSYIFRIGRDSGRRIYLTHVEAVDRVQVFDSTGTYLHTIGDTIGHSSFRFPRQVLETPQGMWVLDPVMRRATVVAPQTGRLLGVHSAPFSVSYATVLSTGEVVVNAVIRTPRLVAFPLHLLDSSAQIRRSFGQGEAFRRDVPWSGARVVAAGMDGTVWAAPRTRYVLQQWSNEGQLIRTLQRDVPWFRPHARNIDVDLDTPPSPLIEGMQMDPAGRLWVFTLVADREWQEGVRLRTGNEQYNQISNQHRYWDTMVEVFDVEAGAVVAQARLDEYVEHLAGRELLYGVYLEEGRPHPTIEIRRTEFVNSSTGGGGR